MHEFLADCLAKSSHTHVCMGLNFFILEKICVLNMKQAMLGLVCLEFSLMANSSFSMTQKRSDGNAFQISKDFVLHVW